MSSRKFKKEGGGMSREDQDRIIESTIRQLNIDIKRALTSYTILFVLKIRPHYAFEVINKVTEIRTLQGKYSILEESEIPVAPKVIYNNFRKLEKKGILGSYKKKSEVGPDRKYYYLTELGERLFDEAVVKVIYPRLLLFITAIDKRVEEWGGGPSKKELNKLQGLVDVIFNR